MKSIDVEMMEMYQTGKVNGIPWQIHDARQAEYHRRRLELWELGMPDNQYTQACRDLRKEIGL